MLPVRVAVLHAMADVAALGADRWRLRAAILLLLLLLIRIHLRLGRLRLGIQEVLSSVVWALVVEVALSVAIEARVERLRCSGLPAVDGAVSQLVAVVARQWSAWLASAAAFATKATAAPPRARVLVLLKAVRRAAVRIRPATGRWRWSWLALSCRGRLGGLHGWLSR